MAPHGPRVLLVDADEPTRAFLADNLTADGYTVAAAADHAALHAALADTPTLAVAIVATHQLGDVAPEVLHRQPETAIIGLGRRDTLDATLAQTLTDVIPKPFSYPELRLRLDRAIAGEHRPRRPGMTPTTNPAAGLEKRARVLIAYPNPPAVAAEIGNDGHTGRVGMVVDLDPHEPDRFNSLVTLRFDDEQEAPIMVSRVARLAADVADARQRRLRRLLDEYDPHPDHGPSVLGPLRFVLIQQEFDGALHAYTYGDTFDEAVADAGGEILDGWRPEAVFDLDTGARIGLHVSSPIVTRSVEQGVMANVLDDDT